MNDRRDRALGLRDMADGELGAALRQAFAFPVTPDLAPGLLSQLGEAVPPQRRRWSWPRLSRGMVLALLALLVVAAVTAAAILGVTGIRILTTDELERPQPSVSAPAWDVDDVGAALGLGSRMSLDDIRARVEMPVVPPADEAIGPPDALYLDPLVAGGMVSMAYTARLDLPAADETGAGLLISQFDGSINRDGFQKLRDQDVEVESVSVAGAQGWWLHGATHLFLRRAGTGDESRPVVPSRRAGDTLLWERDGLTYRLEGSVSMERAIEIAESIAGNE